MKKQKGQLKCELRYLKLDVFEMKVVITNKQTKPIRKQQFQ